ncbi:MAG: hypothetical protein NVSMB33_08850 [Ktedonobacteraceae bacterium]
MVIKSNWRKYVAVWRNRLYLYPPPEPMPRTRLFWIATGLVAFFALLFAGYFSLYMTARHDAFGTTAEDLGIMDQAIWTMVQGHLPHQTVCNIVNDINCYSANGVDGITRFAIHFEPMLFLVSLFYLVLPNPKTLLVLQSVVVASGAFPAFWLARLRLRNDLAAVVMAVLYLLFPAQQQATVFDFHAVTFTAALLLFTLYFMYTRRTVWLIVFAILSMACKEEIAFSIIIFGLWSMLFQQRWRSGLALVLMACVWLGGEYLIIRHFSPLGHPLLSSRFSNLGHSPVEIAKTVLLHPIYILRMYVFEPTRILYLRILLSPAAYLPLLAPWIFVLAVPSLAVNLLSSDSNMHSGFFQYNAEIVPMLIFSTIEAIVLLLWIVQRITDQLQARQPKPVSIAEKRSSREGIRSPGYWVNLVLLVSLMTFVMYSVVRADAVRGAMPFSAVGRDSYQGATQYATTYQWPQTNAHTDLAQRFIDMIPASASVSAQTRLVPHVSHRMNIYLFPYADDRADYIFLDVTANTYPLYSDQYIHEVKTVLFSGQYGIVAAQDGYLLLKKGLPAVGVSPYSPYGSSSTVDHLLPNLPPEFCSFLNVAPQQVQNPLQATFSESTTSALNLVGIYMPLYSVYSLSSGSSQLTTYWTVHAPTKEPARFLVILTDKDGNQHFVTTAFPGITWCPTNTWQSGKVYSVIGNVFLLRDIPAGIAHISLVLLPATHTVDTMVDEQSWFPVKVEHAPATVTVNTGGNSLQLATVPLVP